jgi:NAD+ synthetase
MIVDALTLGVRDYLFKCGFERACIGLSGGIDSALVATLAVRALGKDKVVGASMPGKFSSEGSKTDAFDLARNLGIECVSMPIDPGFAGLSEVLNPAFSELGERTLGQHLPDLTQENLQSRIRGTMMMALSNRTGALVLTTGNKSEIAVGYCTLYGDMNGGLAVIADLPKTMVFRVCRYINEHFAALGFDRAPIPVNTIEKPPSAELAPDQLDSDSLPEYEILDQIVHRHIELHQSASRIIEETGIDADVVRRFCSMIDRNEYKRQQMAVGLRVTSKAFGAGRRMPIAQRWTR